MNRAQRRKLKRDEKWKNCPQRKAQEDIRARRLAKLPRHELLILRMAGVL